MSVRGRGGCIARTGASVDARGASVALTDASVDARVASVALTDASVDTRVASVALTGASVDARVASVALTGASVDARDASVVACGCIRRCEGRVRCRLRVHPSTRGTRPLSLTEMSVDVKDAFTSRMDVPVDVNDAPMPHDGCARKRHSCAQGSDGSPDRHEGRPEAGVLSSIWEWFPLRSEVRPFSSPKRGAPERRWDRHQRPRLRLRPAHRELPLGPLRPLNIARTATRWSLD
jgi:hypothetical protein